MKFSTQHGVLFLIRLAVLVVFSLGAYGQVNPYGPEEATEKLNEISRCRLELSPLLRLDCYDRMLMPNLATITSSTQRGNSWQRAVNQEQQRDTPSTDFFVSDDNSDDHRQIIITTPAIGRQPPRPILMFSCVDNITRMQIALMEPIAGGETNITLKLDQNSFLMHWFIRENGYVLESARGLPGISEIQRLFHSAALTLVSDEQVINGLTFNIMDLKQAIKPLRSACHW